MASYEFKPQAPIRAFALAAALSLVGACAIVVSQLIGGPGSGLIIVGLIIVGTVLMVAALGLLAVAMVCLRRNRVQVSLDEQGYTLTGPQGTYRGDWSTVTKVTSLDGGTRLAISHGETEGAVVSNQRREDDHQMQALSDEVVTRLDASRGYSNWV